MKRKAKVHNDKEAIQFLAKKAELKRKRQERDAKNKLLKQQQQ